MPASTKTAVSRLVQGSFLCALFLVEGCGPVVAATGPANPQTLQGRLEQARPGDTIRLEPGTYGVVTFPRRTWSPGITIEAEGARFAGIEMENANGVTLRGGSVAGAGVRRGYGLFVSHASNVRVEGVAFSEVRRGIVVNESSDVQLVGNRFVGVQTEGINLALSRRILVEANFCDEFMPRPPEFDANGRKVRDGDHPDCIQAWSRPSAPPSADIVVQKNVIQGNTQGIFFGNHIRDGVDDGGFDRVTIRDNQVRIRFPSGIVLGGARDSQVVNNAVASVPGAELVGRPGRKLKVALRVTGERNRVCGNTVSDIPGDPAGTACP